jgi:hypothetical protein
MNVCRHLKLTAFILSSAAVSLLTGCASSERAYYQNGNMGYLVKCGGLAGRWSACSNAAAALCTSYGYDVLARNGIAKASEEEANAHVAGNSFHTRDMYIQCRGSRLAWKIEGPMSASLDAAGRAES